uniref:Uncharacterized protein n=1 Tax=Trichobilharzia regenti TaxID=157069 RepID=A0AA85JTV9_TRIRE|nr:unnamed protein product [Trichobilharzia regenti]
MSTKQESQYEAEKSTTNLLITNSVNHLVDKVNILSDQINHCMNISSQYADTLSKSINTNNPHTLYAHNRSLQCIIRKLFCLKQSNQNVIKSLQRYQGYIEKLIFDICQEMISNSQADMLRIKCSRHKHDGIVQQVVRTECQLLKNLKRTLESKMKLLLHTIKNVKCIQIKLDEWICEHDRMIVQTERINERQSNSIVLEKQVETLNDSYSTSMNFNKILKTIEFTVSHANRLQFDLLCTFERIQHFLNGTRKSVYYALTEDCSFLVRQMHQLFISNLKQKMAHNRNLKMMNQIMGQTPNKSNEKVMKKLLANNEQLQTVRRELSLQYDHLNQYMQADLETLRSRRRQQTEHLIKSNGAEMSLIITRINPQQHRI